ncbi:MAG: hypothetical protein JW941_03625 [Candidatus Coatesbacteria bacterium]|nr:hypothetical protein [Candidatus Coatesbacteria bacterium]
MRTIEVISSRQLPEAESNSPDGDEIVFYPVYRFSAKLFAKPVIGAEKERRFVVLVDAVDGLARLYNDLPASPERDVEEKRVLPSEVEPDVAIASAEKALNSYSLAKYRGLSPTRIVLSGGELVYKAFFIRREGKDATVIDGLTGKETILSGR